MQRSAEEIVLRAKDILSDNSVTSLVQESASPTAAFDLVFVRYQDRTKAKAARWLAVLRRDHPEEFDRLIHANSRHTEFGTARNS